MSKTVPVTFGERMFWAYDVSLGILLLETIEVAAEQPDPTFANVLTDLRTQVEVGASYAFELDDSSWTGAQRTRLTTLIAEAARRLRVRGVISAAEANRRYQIDGEPYHLRLAKEIDGEVIADLADKIALLVRDELPSLPDAEHHWFYGAGKDPGLL
ncbi:hypothetical protein [Actinoplanes subglobosus]|uniref:Uncharacterized protein n=1 Tax=Actinoplanes subglobosus TaxID=1547892 RepID=A0ABV8IQY1_9ACTN